MSYSDVINSDQNFTDLPIVIKFALPLRKEMFANPRLMDKLFMQCVSAIQKSLPPETVKFTTIFRSLIKRAKGNLKAVTVIAPQSQKDNIIHLIIDGFIINGKVVRPYSVEQPQSFDYPKTFITQWKNLPHFISKSELLSIAGLSEFDCKNIYHSRRSVPGGEYFYTGDAKLEVVVQDADEEVRLSEWANASFSRLYTWQGADFKGTCLQFLHCPYCRVRHRDVNHHISQCPFQHEASTETKDYETETTKEVQTNSKDACVQTSDSAEEAQQLSCHLTAQHLEESETSASTTSDETPQAKHQKTDNSYAPHFIRDPESYVLQHLNGQESILPIKSVPIDVDSMTTLLSASKDTVKINEAHYNFTYAHTNKKTIEKSFKLYHWRCDRTGHSIKDYNTIKESLGKYDLYYSEATGQLKTVNLWSRVTGSYQLMMRPNDAIETEKQQQPAG